ncbi:unnamed protein product [Adineta steineri]|uniref:Uncharacterized protein n=1 Tax=Adineta steineri TaxID=433720 RepID=A0A813ZXE4_9BILA|nr:unnamed protein product [Adineta steineri]
MNEYFLNATQSTFTSNIPLSNIISILNSLWKNSLRTIVSSTSSYTLNSLVSIFCGIYALNLNFVKEVKEVNEENIFYEKCLRELLHHTFCPAFFIAACDDFDRQ